MTTEQVQQTGFISNYSHHAKIEETAKGEQRVTVSIFSSDRETVKNEVIRLYNEIKKELK